MEIERKFLIKHLSFDISSYPQCSITQSYISMNPTIRLRKSNQDIFLTVKGSGALAREEFELPITKTQYLSLLQKVDTPSVIKTRYFIPLENKLIAELDVYNGNLKGLLTVEVEFQTLEQAYAFNPPSWFGLEVTEDNRYKNTNLAIYGIPEKK